METPPHSSPLIPATVPQARPRGERMPTPPGVERASAPIRVYNGPGRTPAASLDAPLEPEDRKLARDLMAHLAEQELGRLPYPHTVATRQRGRVAQEIASEVLNRVRLDSTLPDQLRIFEVRAYRGDHGASSPEGIAFNVAAWSTDTPPPRVLVNPQPDPSAWYPHDPLGHGGTEPDFARATVAFSVRPRAGVRTPR